MPGRQGLRAIDSPERVFYAGSVDAAHYTEILCKSALNRAQGMPFKWSLNPYQGCRHGCSYCYARRYHEWLDLTPADFDSRIFVKSNIVSVLRAELRRPSWKREYVALGTPKGSTGTRAIGRLAAGHMRD